jgi:hypothetical protein
MKLITLFILLIAANLSFAQGTLTDELTGMTLEYPEGWTEVTSMEPAGFLYSEEGAIVIQTRYTDTVLTTDEMLDDLEKNLGKYTNILNSIYKDDIAISNFGRGIIGSHEAAVITAIMKLEESNYQKLKLLILDHNNFAYFFIVMPTGEDEPFTREALLLLTNVVFP